MKNPAPIQGGGATCTTVVKVFGHVLDRIHTRGLDAPARLWLLCRALDTTGAGRVAIDTLRDELAERGGRLKLTWRRVRQMLHEPLFFRNTAQGGARPNGARPNGARPEYIYYNSEARVAATLGIGEVRGYAVAVPRSALYGSVVNIRAIGHDAFHSTRTEGLGNPITRGVVEARGGGDPRTQRRYEAVRGVKVQAQSAIEGEYGKGELHRCKGMGHGEKRGGPAFSFVDFQGKHATPGQRPWAEHYHCIYISRRIANAYEGTLPAVVRSRRWLNIRITQRGKGLGHLSDLGGDVKGEYQPLYFDSYNQAVDKAPSFDALPFYVTTPVDNYEGRVGWWHLHGRPHSDVKGTKNGLTSGVFFYE